MIKNLVVNLSTGNDEDGARDYAVSLARELDAHLAAVAFAYEPIPAATLIDDAPGEWLDELRQEAEEAANAAIERFNAAVRGSGILAEARALTTTMTGAAPALRGLPYQVIVDGRNARGRFGRHPNCFPLSVRTGDPPKVHDAPVDCNVEQQSMRPGLVVQMREDAVPNGRVGKLDIQVLVAAGQGLKEVRSAHDAEKRASLTIGTRLMECLSSKAAISCSGVSGDAVITSRVITSATVRACALVYSAASASSPVSTRSHQECRRWVPSPPGASSRLR
jgi:hypothetical protein